MDLLYELLADLKFGDGLRLVAGQPVLVSDEIEYRHVCRLKENTVKANDF